MKIHVYKIINMIDFNNIGVKANTVMNFSCNFLKLNTDVDVIWMMYRIIPSCYSVPKIFQKKNKFYI